MPARPTAGPKWIPMDVPAPKCPGLGWFRAISRSFCSFSGSGSVDDFPMLDATGSGRLPPMLLRALTAVSLLFVSTSLAQAQSWEQVGESEGIVVWQRPVHGTSLVEFRGRGLVKGNIRRVLAVLADHDRKTEWMHQCVASKLIQAFEPGRLILYNRTGSPYPFISDRDVVIEAQVQFWPEKKQIRIDAWNVENARVPELNGVVRMPKLIVSWILVQKDDKLTEVTYEVQADPGGSLPKWLVNLASKNLPLKSIVNLRTQLGKDYAQQLALVEASFDWDSVGM
jgi:hypothetical protein